MQRVLITRSTGVRRTGAIKTDDVGTGAWRRHNRCRVQRKCRVAYRCVWGEGGRRQGEVAGTSLAGKGLRDLAERAGRVGRGQGKAGCVAVWVLTVYMLAALHSLCLHVGLCSVCLCLELLLFA